jgi:pyruvate formate lyase activating enzyme
MSAGDDPGYSQEELFEYLNKRKKLIEGICITGGEPTFWADLPDFIQQLKDTGLKVKLDTNGSNPAIVKDILEKDLIDYIAMDVKTSLEKYYLFKGPENTEESVRMTIQLIMSSDIPYEFRTTCVPGVVTEEDIYHIAETIKDAKKHYLQQFRPHENVLEDKYSRLKPYSKNKLDEFKSISEKFVQSVAIRGI